MRNNRKREQILDAMQALMSSQDARTISVDQIARTAGISKGSIYYYFSSKNDILDAVIERSYSRVLDEGKALAAASHVDVFRKMEIIYHACLDASSELSRQEELGSFNEQQENAFIHQKFARILITQLRPILADILRQGIREGSICCPQPDETAYIVLLILTQTLDNHLVPSSKEEIGRVLSAFASMQERALDIPAGSLSFLTGAAGRDS